MIRRLALMASLFAPLAAAAADLPVTFSATGDVPYTEVGYEKFIQQIDQQNAHVTDAEFFVHLGDLHHSAACEDFRYERTATQLKRLTIPVFVTPGDNDWNDCDDPVAGWARFQKYFANFDRNWPSAPTVARQAAHPENVAWVTNGVLIMTVHLVAGRIVDRTEWDQRLQDDADWVNQHMTAHASDTRAAVLLTQASVPGTAGSFDLFLDSFQASAAAYGKPILYLHGDGHVWQLQTGFRAPNVTRVQVVEGDLAPPIKVTVTTDTVPAFVINRDSVPNRAPVVTITGAPLLRTVPNFAFTINARIMDDNIPQTPGQWTRQWRKVSGPGNVTFSPATGSSRLGSPNNSNTKATFTSSGTYVLGLAANDSALTTEVFVQVDVSLNVAPTVNAGGTMRAASGRPLRLNGIYSDDGLPLAADVTWAYRGGPAAVTFSDRKNRNSNATFPMPGRYFLVFSGTDGVSTATDDLTVNVEAEAPSGDTPVSPLRGRSLANPSRGESIEIDYHLDDARSVRATVHDQLGREIRSLTGDGTAGDHRLRWEGRDDNGALVPADSYLIRLELGSSVQKRRVVIVH